MSDPVTLGLAVAQVVVPVALVAMPHVWTGIVKVLQRIPRTSKDRPDRHNTNLACIHSILDSLEHMPDLAWTKQSHSQSLLNNLKLKAESVENMIENDKGRFLQYLHRSKFAKTIQSIALMMQLLETNIRLRQASTSIKSDKLDLTFYQKRRENLCKDLLDILDKDDLEPVVNPASVERSGTYERIVYEFKCEPERGYPMCVSRGVRECLEALLKWLRDLRLLQDTINTGSSSLLGVALYELFSEVLPKVLLQHLRGDRQRSKLNTQTAKQFHSNVCFLRSFSVSPTFKAIQGEDGLQLEDEDKIAVDLLDDGWVTWNDVEQESFSTFDLENRPISFLEITGPSSQGGVSTTAHSGNIHFPWEAQLFGIGNMDSSPGDQLCGIRNTDSSQENQFRGIGNMGPLECALCGFIITGSSPEDTLRFEQHWDACFRNEQQLNDYIEIHRSCPICTVSIHGLSLDQRQLHANACLDRN